jgi:hypothetical protein
VTVTAAKVTTIAEPQLAGTTSRLTMMITQEDGVTGFKPTTLTLTLVEKTTQSIINGKNETDILIYCDANGNLSLEMTPADQALLDSSILGSIEVHQAILEWTWQGGTRKGAAIVEYVLQRNANV